MISDAKSKVYIKTDTAGRITRCEGGYTTPSNLTGWIEIDSGYGDKYNLCQTHYFEGGLRTVDGIPRYKYENNTVYTRSEEEIQKDRESRPSPNPINEENMEQLKKENNLLKAQIQAQTERSDFVEDCIAEMATQIYN